MEPQVSGLQAVCSRGRENGKVLAGKMWSTLWRSKRWRRKRSLFLVYLKVFEYIIPDGKTLLIAFVRICASIESFCLTRRLRVCEYSVDYLRDPLFSDSGGRSMRNSYLKVKVWIGLVSVMTSLLRPTVEFVQSLSTTESSVLVSILCFTQTDSHLQLHLMHHTRFLSNQVTLMHTL